MAEKTQFEVEFPTIDTSSSEIMITNASHYRLNRDKVKRKIVTSERDNYDSLECHALNVDEGFQNS